MFIDDENCRLDHRIHRTMCVAVGRRTIKLNALDKFVKQLAKISDYYSLPHS